LLFGTGMPLGRKPFWPWRAMRSSVVVTVEGLSTQPAAPATSVPPSAITKDFSMGGSLCSDEANPFFAITYWNLYGSWQKPIRTLFRIQSSMVLSTCDHNCILVDSGHIASNA